MTPSASPDASAEGPSAEELIEYYYDQGFTDGLPVVPPSAASIQAMLDAAGLQADELVATLPSHNSVILADKVAINAVMAGCKPAYMPVVTAAVRAFCHPDFTGPATTTTTASTAIGIIVNGPIALQLGINATDNLFGPGYRANATIGRALRLILMNLLGFRPVRLDRSTLGNAAKYSFCFAEDEAHSPWEPLHVERGFRPQDSTVTLVTAIGQTTIRTSDGSDPLPNLLSMADAMSFLGSHNILGQGELLVVFAHEPAERFRTAGWSKGQIKQFLFEHAKRTVADLKRAGRLREALEAGDETTWRHVVQQPEDIIVVAAGGHVGHHAACIPGWGLQNPPRSVTLPITLP